MVYVIIMQLRLMLAKVSIMLTATMMVSAIIVVMELPVKEMGIVANKIASKRKIAAKEQEHNTATAVKISAQAIRLLTRNKS